MPKATAGIKAIQEAVHAACGIVQDRLGTTFIAFLSDGQPMDNLFVAGNQLNTILLSLGKGKSVFYTVGFGGWSSDPMHGDDFAPLRQLADWADNGKYQCAPITIFSGLLENRDSCLVQSVRNLSLLAYFTLFRTNQLYENEV